MAWARDALLGALLLLLALLVLAAAWGSRAQAALLGGYWVGDPAFLEPAGLSELILYVAPDLATGYLVMVDAGGGFLANAPLALRFRAGLASALPAGLTWRGALDVAPAGGDGGLEGEKAAGAPAPAEPPGLPVPARLEYVLAGAEGTLALHAGGRLFAFLDKDPAASRAALAALEAPSRSSESSEKQEQGLPPVLKNPAEPARAT